MKTKLAVLFAIAVLLVGVPVWAEEVVTETTPPEWQINVGTFGEGDTRRFDYIVIYLTASTKVGGQPFRIQLDWFDNPAGLGRLWINYGDLKLTDSEDFALSFKPGVLVTNDGRWWGGGFLQSEIPALRLSTNWKSAWGPKCDRHLWFTNVAISEEFGVGHVLYMQQGYTPDSYLGPYVNLGDVYLWGGPSLTRPGAWSVNLEAPIIRF